MNANDEPASMDDRAKKEFVKSNAGLTSVPTKVIVNAELELLDLSHNEIEVVPKGVFPEIMLLKTLQLSHNMIKALPDDISHLKQLQVLDLQHNRLSALPDGLFTLCALRELDVSCNLLNYIPSTIGKMESLQVLNTAGNKLRAMPCDVGWLGLKQLNITDNPDLHIPAHVLQCGFRAVMSYLQVVGEQHALVARHLAAFTSRLTELGKHGIVLGSMEDEGAVMTRVKVAQRLGIFSCSHCQLATFPAGFDDQHEALSKVQVADISHNLLRRLPLTPLMLMKQLVVLNMSYNKLKTLELTADLQMQSVRVLDLSFNKLLSLPADLGLRLPALQQLYLSNNFLSTLPDSLDQAAIQDMFLSENLFESVPEVLGRCQNLVKLSLAACQLTVIREEIASLTGLRFLDASFNKLTTLPCCMSSLVALAALNLSFNPLSSFPDVCCSMHSLQELNLDNTGITSVPEGLGQLRLLEGLQAEGCPLAQPFAALYAKDPLLLVKVHDPLMQSLDLSDMGLEVVPPQLLQLAALTALNLNRNAIKDLPQELGQLQALAQVSLRGNPLRQPYLKLLDAKGEQSLLSFLRPDGTQGELDIEGCGFETLPREVWELPGRSGLVALQLTNNRLRDLPNELSTLGNLTRLVLDNNLLRSVPAPVLTLTSLQILMASNNNITYLPEALGTAQQLQALIMHSNQLMQLPDSMTQLKNLRALAVTSNRLWQLPAGISVCVGLRLLDCSHNLMSRLPGGLGKLTRLRSLKLTHNKLAFVPVDELKQLPGLTELHLAANSFTVPMELNASNEHAVQQLLEAVASSPAGQPPPAATFSRHPSSLYSNVNSASPSTADSVRSFNPARSRLDGSGSPYKDPTCPSHGRASGVRWSDEAGDEHCCASVNGGSSVMEGSGSRRASWTGAAAVAVASCMRHSIDGSADGGSMVGQAASKHAVHFSNEGAGTAGSDALTHSACLAAAATITAHNNNNINALHAGDEHSGQADSSTTNARYECTGGSSSSSSTTTTTTTTATAGATSSVTSAEVQKDECLPAVMQPPDTKQKPCSHAGLAPAMSQPTALVHMQEATRALQEEGMAAACGSCSTAAPVTGKATTPSTAGKLIAPAAAACSSFASTKQLVVGEEKPQSQLSCCSMAALHKAVDKLPHESDPFSLDDVPVMDIPRIIRVLTEAPAPPAPQAVGGGQVDPATGQPGMTRPQTKARFKRVIQQTAMAMALLERSMQQQGPM